MDTREESYPKTNDVWEQPNTLNLYVVHSLSADGWTRYVSTQLGYRVPKIYPMYTMPTDEFMKRYRKVDWMKTEAFS